MKNFKVKNPNAKVLQKEAAALAVAAAVMVTAALAGCKPKGDAAGQGQPPVYAVSAVTVGTGNIADYLTLSGDMVAGSSVDVFSDTAGTITRRFVSIGSAVEKNQPVAEVDPSQPGMQYIASIVRAPIAGVISNLPGQVGMKITQSSSLAVISGGGGLEIQLNVAERFIYRIRMGLPCEITLDAYPNDRFRGRISEISPVINVSSRTMRIKVNVENPGNMLKAGMFANVKIITEEKNNVITVPETAVLQRGGERFVYTVEPDPSDANFKIARRMTVTTGLNIDNMIEVTDGIKAGDMIVVRGQTTFSDGSRVNIIQ
ncbi:MAG: efflux RND transporter periplasmic adaptor subunit [Spirochaetaceae bacterium]|nr:efflux RND transporter periplasmic adaptor subunit [Spirochaetaceae bacterium]